MPERTHIELRLWNRWVPIRKERTADGTTALYFGFGCLSWQRPVLFTDYGDPDA